MNRTSLLNSLRFRLVTIDGRLAAFSALIAIAMLANWIFGLQQFVYYYLEFGETDVPPEYFFTLFPVLLGSLLFASALILSAVILRLRIRHWARQLTMFAAYEPLFMPAYAGLLFDYSHGRKEALSMLLDLHFRGAIRVTLVSEEFRFVVINDSSETLNDAERVLLDAALQYGGDEALCRAVLKDGFRVARESEQFLDFDLDYKAVKRSDAFIFVAIVIGGAYALLWTLSIISDLEAYLTLVYPRYPATIYHLFVLGVLSLVPILIIPTGLLPRFSSNHTAPHVSTWMHVAGWRYYLQTIYKDRMSPKHIFSQDPSEIKNVLPYMVAFGIIDINRLDIPRLLQYVDGS